MSKHGKVDMSNGWALEDASGLANVATNKAEAAGRKQTIDDADVFPASVSSPKIQATDLIVHGQLVGVTGVQAAHIEDIGVDLTAAVAAANAIIHALENVGILAAS